MPTIPTGTYVPTHYSAPSGVGSPVALHVFGFTLAQVCPLSLLSCVRTNVLVDHGFGTYVKDLLQQVLPA